MKQKRFRFLIAAAFFLTAALALFIRNSHRIGRVLDSYKGVSVYDNGLLFYRSYGKHYAPDGYYFGQKWQCVEFETSEKGCLSCWF